MSTTAHVKLLCHAATAATRNASFPADEPVDEQGRRKLSALVGRLAHADHRLTSPARAARETAEILGITTTEDLGLRDCDYGRWQGLSLLDVEAREPDALLSWLSDPTSAPHGGDSVVQLMDRMSAWLAARAAIPGVTLAVTHAGIVRAAVASALGAGPQACGHIDIGPLSLVRLSHHNGRWTLGSLGKAGEEAD